MYGLTFAIDFFSSCVYDLLSHPPSEGSAPLHPSSGCTSHLALKEGERERGRERARESGGGGEGREREMEMREQCTWIKSMHAIFPQIFKAESVWG
ncbi:MAG: hypothetical protein MJE68_00550 [Proteobacteria bacterium]|nr:hypothetical protein [Pseudomonadota bacterium]